MKQESWKRKMKCWREINRGEEKRVWLTYEEKTQDGDRQKELLIWLFFWLLSWCTVCTTWRNDLGCSLCSIKGSKWLHAAQQSSTNTHTQTNKEEDTCAHPPQPPTPLLDRSLCSWFKFSLWSSESLNLRFALLLQLPPTKEMLLHILWQAVLMNCCMIWY